MGHPNQPLPAVTSQEPPLDRVWPQESVRQVRWAPLRTLNVPATQALKTDLLPRGLGGHWEMICACLGLSRGRPQDSSSAAQTLQPAGEVRCLAWGDCLPTSVHRLPETPPLGFSVGRAI